MAKILVADDNSNIQKMVGLALKDHGIEVVAVGNGEAAVRKIADVRPDLVLADVFMPVRNGYEVCKFVKADSALAHIPVILLVGAFDPLDEQEAQRVGADGVLKKPFVPPDPLISMVKSALVRAASGHMAVSSSAAEKSTTASMIGDGRSATVGYSGAPTVVAIPEPAVEAQTYVEDIPARPEELKIESSGQPLAFGNLMNTAAPAVEEDSVYIAPVNPELADRDFGAPEVDEEEEEEEESENSWRRDGGNEAFADDTGKAAETRAKRRESWTPTREKTQDLLEAAVEPDIISTPPLEIRASAPPPPPPQAPPAAPVADSSAPSKKQKTETKANVVESAPPPVPVSKTPSVAEVPPPPPPPAPALPESAATEAPVAETAKPESANSWFSTTSSPWEAEAQKATQLASTWDAPAVPPKQEETPPAEQEFHVDSTLPSDFVSEAPSEEPVYYQPDPGLVGNEPVTKETLPELIPEGSLPEETVETIRHETSFVVERVVQEAQQAPADGAAKEVSPAAPDMDELVAKVLAKMSPDMLRAVTREILKPVVEAMVRDEIGSKK